MTGHFAQCLSREYCGHYEPAISFQLGIGNARYAHGDGAVLRFPHLQENAAQLFAETKMRMRRCSEPAIK
jgi:hypothetical protein